MGSIHHAVLHVLTTRVLDDRDRIDRVAAQDVRVRSGIAVGASVERDTLVIAERERDRRIDRLRHMQTIDTVASFLRMVDTYIDARIGDRRILPVVRRTFLQTLVLVFLEMRIQVNDIRNDTVFRRTCHQKRVIQGRRFVNDHRTRTQTHRVARTDGVVTSLFDAVLGQSTRRCRNE